MASVFFSNTSFVIILISLFHRNESFLFSASALTPKLHTWIHDHKTLGRDKEMGEGDVDVSFYFWFPFDAIALFMNPNRSGVISNQRAFRPPKSLSNFDKEAFYDCAYNLMQELTRTLPVVVLQSVPSVCPHPQKHPLVSAFEAAVRTTTATTQIDLISFHFQYYLVMVNLCLWTCVQYFW